MVNDPIGDMLARIKNAINAGFDSVEIPNSKMKQRIAEILKEQGYIEDFSVIDDRLQGILKLYLRYQYQRRNVIVGLKRISKPGRRVYVDKNNIPLVQRGLGIAILSTSSGVMADSEARKLGVGGEVLLSVW
ncbi:MAG: 30S ribosomal protein S8 [Myxococcota bacterium]|jgi:small subunit ribosomal protein S8|nr:30S ribosomal protein S8 [Myxococcota bacterium]OQC40778.1 MAG: 30S ribosomal protein S8 [Deltaproteobacteria bacterium ADurb.Bin058]HHW96978.1 30S ribosomal protein S8 [Oligoflexales bacterium]MBP8970294.1 30S ribosomal protein S8 [Myxococcota bacterium]HOE82556.1 30S ribosomal protein S8 [Myxococcota bacterium]